ncbi:MAG: lysophospholipid acyltransferase family protein [Gemmatimonadota bacterium]|nr:MAG: lysophospholipid acyltransferase family protein [Gemmatimonadota bacterium]
MLRVLLAYGACVLVTGWYAGKAALYSLLRMETRLCRECDAIQRRWSRALLWLTGCRVRVEGGEHLQEGGARIIVSNHQSWFDVFALTGYLPTSVRFVTKAELAKIPIFGRAWKGCGHVSIDRNDRTGAIESLDLAGRRIRDEGITIVMFAEGTRSRSGELQPFKKGAFVLAIQGGVPIVPVGMIGTHQIMPKGSFRFRPGEIVIRVGEPIQVDGLTNEDRDTLKERTWRAVAELKRREPAKGKLENRAS